jgi:hypothetical protein
VGTVIAHVKGALHEPSDIGSGSLATSSLTVSSLTTSRGPASASLATGSLTTSGGGVMTSPLSDVGALVSMSYEVVTSAIAPASSLQSALCAQSLETITPQPCIASAQHTHAAIAVAQAHKPRSNARTRRNGTCMT